MWLLIIDYLITPNPRCPARVYPVVLSPSSCAANELVKVTEQAIEAGAGDDGRQELAAGGRPPLRAVLSDVQLAPDSLCGLGWADNERLLTCRVRAELTDTVLGKQSLSGLTQTPNWGLG